MTDPETQLTVQSVAHAVNLRVDGLIGGRDVTLTSPSGELTFKLPAAMCPAKVGEIAVVGFTITRVAVEPAPSSSPLILPSQH